MKQNKKSHVIILIILFVMIGTSFSTVSSSKDISSLDRRGGKFINGQILFAPYSTTTTYLIDRNGTINHTWSSLYKPFTSAYWLGDGTILRPISSGNGGIQKILWDGTLAWDYRYIGSGSTCHHDIKYLPNGNVLMIVWVTKTRTEAIAAGRNPSTILGNTFTTDKIIEVNQTGPTSGEVIWEWNVWDHLIQDYDSSKANYGVVMDHPELIDINYGDSFVGDWLHTNSVDYSPEFDQILIDIHNFNEVWVVDHSTTTEEAAGHTGGNYGMGGDLLYRWGNPEAYDRGTPSDQKLFFQHDASWIEPGYPGAGHILIFNNGNNRPSGKYSSVDEFAPPVNSTGEYYLEPGSAYGPEDYTWSYIASPPTSFYSDVFGGALRLKDGNTLICGGLTGKFFEVTPDKTVVWQYMNPYPTPTHNEVFKIDFIPPKDTMPPVTTCNIAGTNPVTITLNATDDDSGVGYTKYKIDDDAYKNYTMPVEATEAGDHVVYFYSVDLAGNIEIEKSASFPVEGSPPTPSILITITGGFGVSAIIKNNGTTNLTNIAWTINLDGKLIFVGKAQSGTIDVLTAGELVTVKDFVIGFGKTKIVATAGDTETSASGMVLLFFVRGVT
jgi:hypothetical protein